MTSWVDIDQELSHWDQPATLWWRDDDAIAASTELEQIISFSKQYFIPLHLAVIPQPMENSLIERLQDESSVFVLQHGFNHQNHAFPEQKKIELGGTQTAETLCQQLDQGRQTLIKKFGQRYIDILVPPWNRIEEQVVQQLPALGYQRLSVLGIAAPSTGLPRVNVHIDIIDWKKRCFTGEDSVLSSLLKHLQSRRLNQTMNSDPTGLMTHHLVHDAACNEFLQKFFSTCAQRPNLQWLGGEQLLH